MTVHLLKNKTEDTDLSRQDLYEQHIKDSHFVPILKYVPVEFAAIVTTLNTLDFNSIIVTSQRAVDVLRDAISQCIHPQKVFSLPAYTVGPATAERLKLVGFNTVIGSNTGNGQALTAKMLEECNKSQKFMFFAGEIHRPYLANKLNENGFSVTTQIVYKTHALDFLPTLRDSIKPNDWVVFFSPSFSQDILPLLEDVRVAAIGPTTRQYLEENGVKVDAMAEEPTAEGLARALSCSNSTGCV